MKILTAPLRLSLCTD